MYSSFKSIIEFLLVCSLNSLFFRCKGETSGRITQDLVPEKTGYGWNIPYVSTGTGSSISAFVPVGSYPDNYEYYEKNKIFLEQFS